MSSLLLAFCLISLILCDFLCSSVSFSFYTYVYIILPPPSIVRELCKVLFPYTPANDDELELREGEIIAILSRELPDKGWLKGELKGKIGVFPDNFVVLISSEGMVHTHSHTHIHILMLIRRRRRWCDDHNNPFLPSFTVSLESIFLSFRKNCVLKPIG